MPNYTGQDYSTSAFLNECFRGYKDYAYHTQALARLSPENKELFLTTYRESLGLSPDQVHTVTYADNYINARNKSIAAHPGVAFDPDPQRLKELNDLLQSVDQAVQHIGARYHPDNLTQYMEEQRQKALQLIQKQHEEDIKLVESTYAAPANASVLANTLSALKAAHQTQLKAVEDGFKKDIDALHKAVEKEQQRVFIFGALRHGNETMKKKFDELYLQGGTNATISVGGTSGIFEGLEFANLAEYVGNNFKSLTGRSITSTKTGEPPKETYEFTVAMPNISKFWAGVGDLMSGDFSFSSMSYYGDVSDRAMLDLLTTAQLLKLSGETDVYAKVEGFTKNPQLAMRQAHNAFAALLMAGYAEDKIKIIVNGKTYTAKGDKDSNFDALFKNNPARRQEINQLVAMHNKKSTREEFDGMKKEMESERAKYQTLAGGGAPAVAPAAVAPAGAPPAAAPAAAPAPAITAVAPPVAPGSTGPSAGGGSRSS